MELLNDLLSQVGNLNNSALIVGIVVVLGMVIQGIPAVHNGWIAPATLVVAVALAVLTGEVGQVSPNVANHHVRLGMVGVIYWGIGWVLHKQGVNRLGKLLPAPLKALLGIEDSAKKEADPPAPDPRDRPGWPKEDKE